MNGELTTYVKSQVLAIRRGGWPVFLRKLNNRLMRVCCVPLLVVVLPVIIIARALRPLVVIRFGRLSVDRIGHMAWDIELYLYERETMDNGIKTVDFFYYELPVANKQLLKMRLRALKVSRFVYPLWRCNKLLPGGELHNFRISFNDSKYYEARNMLVKSNVHIKFTPEEAAFGNKCLREIGITESREYICFHARESSFLNKVFPGADFKYHDYRDAVIENFLSAAEEMTNRGYFAIRLGKYVENPILTNNSKVIDYSTELRTDFLDIFLLAKCRFLIGTNTGVTDVADIFRKPVVKTNVTQFYAEIQLCGEKDLFLIKKFWLKREHRFLSFREIVGSSLFRLNRTEQVEQAGIELIENTEKEILDITVEMDERLKGTWKSTEEDEELQEQFWSILIESGKFIGPPVSRIGAMFIRQNQYLLE
tara:strand:- start:562 stop:1830 length:1269 start_codon:yes stop_codon:yes gene_type:complete